MSALAPPVQEGCLLPESPGEVRADTGFDDLAAVHELVAEANRLASGIRDLLRRPPHPPARERAGGWRVTRCLYFSFWLSEAG